MSADQSGRLHPIPRATYRLQLHHGFTFADATRLVPYLRDLGISHVYCSPYLKARAGSTHGYDIVDHSAINPEIGSQADLAAFSAALRAADMGQILDIVPNHMGVGGDDNPWWLDVLENGQASAYAAFFDIDWQSAKMELSGKLLLPVLEDHYGTVLENGLLRLVFHAPTGTFTIHYHEHRLPIDPGSYGFVLRQHLDALEQQLGRDHDAFMGFKNLIADFDLLPPHTASDPDSAERRARDQQLHKRNLAALCTAEPRIGEFIDANVQRLNGQSGDPVSFDHLHDLLERQPYRPAYWRVALDEINYRRFFDINALAGLCVEDPRVFERTHRLILQLVADGVVHGLRLDHPDGLYDPQQYFRRLRAAVDGETPDPATAHYILIEKILAVHEELPSGWPLHGTTGYEFINLVNGWLVDPAGERPLTRLYAQVIGDEIDFRELLYERKKFVMRTRLSGELMVLANLLDRVSEADRHTRDYTLHALRDAITEYIACLGVYRTYVDQDGLSRQDRGYIDRALGEARRRSRASDLRVFDFLEQVLLLRSGPDTLSKQVMTHFVMKLQQYSSPVMAKGLEDTSLYLYNRLVSLNEVGGDPRRFGVSTDELHRANTARRRDWPHSMLASSTHDSKRSEDVRARIDVLSELPGPWRSRVGRWRRLNRRHKRELNGEPAPSANDEYLLYQNLVGAWPLEPLDEAGLPEFRDRIAAYAVKAAREAKTYTSWINPSADYEDAIRHFVGALLEHRPGNSFTAELAEFVHEIGRYGMLNGLSQTLIKLSAPGVPDLYQGTELWDLSLVDPDNRRPVDYRRRQALLDEIRRHAEVAGAGAAAAEALRQMDDGRAKLYLVWQVLAARRADPEVFRAGDYRPLTVRGPHAEALCAFARVLDGRCVMAVAARHYTQLMSATDLLPPASVWAGTQIAVPDGIGELRDVLTGEPPAAAVEEGVRWIGAESVLSGFPVALLAGGRG